MTDSEAYQLYPKDSVWYNKLFLAEMLNYNVGYGLIFKSGRYIVRPTVNLQGCGIGATIGDYQKGDQIPIGYFWSEIFTGRHITIDYSKINNSWQQGHTFEGFKNDPENLLQFSMWKRVEYNYELPSIFNSIQASQLNIEIIGDKIIEVHLRHNTDPVDYDVFIPIWEYTQQCPDGFVKINDKEQHPGRLGFFVKRYHEQATI